MTVAQVQPMIEPIAADADRIAEQELIERARHDRAAFGQLYRTHYRDVAQHLYRRTGDRHASGDLTAEVFLSVLRALPRYRYRGVPLRYWLLRIATHAANRWARRRRKVVLSLTQEPVCEASSSSTARVGEIEHARRALLTLSPQHQTVLALRYFEGLSVSEVSAILGCREGTVKSRLARARDALRAAILQGS